MQEAKGAFLPFFPSASISLFYFRHRWRI